MVRAGPHGGGYAHWRWREPSARLAADRFQASGAVSDEKVEVMGLEAWQAMLAERAPSQGPRVAGGVGRRRRTPAARRRRTRPPWETMVFASPRSMPSHFQGMFATSRFARPAGLAGRPQWPCGAPSTRESAWTAQITKDLGLRLITLLLHLGEVEYAADIAAALGLSAEDGLVSPTPAAGTRGGPPRPGADGPPPVSTRRRRCELWQRMAEAHGPGAPRLRVDPPHPGGPDRGHRGDVPPRSARRAGHPPLVSVPETTCTGAPWPVSRAR